MAILLWPLSSFATDKPIYLDYDRVSISFIEKTGLIRVNKEGKLGFIDKQGNSVIDAVYDHMGYFYDDGLVIAAKDNKTGLLNKKGEVIVPFEYDAIDRNSKNNRNKILINDRWGVVDNAFKTIIPIDYEEISFQNNYFILYKNSRYLLANHQGEIITPLGFDEIKVLLNNTVWVRIEGRWHFFNTKTKQVGKVAYDKVEQLRGDFISVRKKGDFSVINGKTHQTVVPFGYKNKDFVGQDLITVEKDNKIGLFNLKGEMVLAPTYDDIGYFNQETTTSVRQGNLSGRINTKGELVVPIKYIPDRTYHSNGYDIQQNADKKWHILASDGVEIGSGYDKVYFVGKDNFAVKNNGKMYLADINNSNKILTKLDQYDDIKRDCCADCYNGNIVVTKNGKYGFITPDGKELIKPIYDGLDSWTNKNLLFKKDNKYGVIDFNGKIEVEAKYNKVEWLDGHPGSEPRGIAYSGDKWQLIDIYSQPISQLSDTKITNIISWMGSIVVKDKKTGLYGSFDTDGNEVLPTQYTSLMPGKTIIEVTQKDKIALFNAQGQQITPFKLKKAFRGYNYDSKVDLVIIHYLIEQKMYWAIYDISTGKALYTNEKINKAGE